MTVLHRFPSGFFVRVSLVCPIQSGILKGREGSVASGERWLNMTRDPVSPSSVFRALRTFRRPWPLLLAGLLWTIFGLILSLFPAASPPPRLMCLGAGVLLAGIAVSQRLRTASWNLEDRAESAGLLAASAFVCLLAFLSMEQSWDSGRIFLGTLIGLALVGSGIVLLPRAGRRVVAVLLLLFHFGGIVTSVTAVPPRGESAPWFSMVLWTYVYRHYLTFAYLTNAYHFYSPDPGPPTLLWFHVEYADGKARWIKIPNRADSPVGLYHQRMLAACESSYNPIMGFPPMDESQIDNMEKKFNRKFLLLPGDRYELSDTSLSKLSKAGVPEAVLKKLEPIKNQDFVTKELFVAELEKLLDKEELADYQASVVRLALHNLRHDTGETIMRRRQRGAIFVPFVDKDGRPAPLKLLPKLPPLLQQYSEPQEIAKRLLASYARHIAHTASDPSDPKNPVKAVRVYRVIHQLISAREFGEGINPLDETTFTPFYMGKYDTEGHLLDPKDPFLYWQVPIVRVPKLYPAPGTFSVTTDGEFLVPMPATEKDTKIIDFVELHATQSDKFQAQQKVE
jgi:uncharacterized membrane protein HdeD (DUF308 family)